MVLIPFWGQIGSVPNNEGIHPDDLVEHEMSYADRFSQWCEQPIGGSNCESDDD